MYNSTESETRSDVVTRYTREEHEFAGGERDSTTVTGLICGWGELAEECVPGMAPPPGGTRRVRVRTVK